MLGFSQSGSYHQLQKLLDFLDLLIFVFSKFTILLLSVHLRYTVQILLC